VDDSEIQLVPADRVSLAQRVAIMNAAYADYFVPTRVTQEQLELMDRCFDIRPTYSVVARTRWQSVGMALLAMRGSRGWISGVGVVPAWRRKGVGRAMMLWLIDQARGLGARRLTLEVISENTGAQRLYKSLGFREVRELLTWRRPADADPLPLPVERLVSVHPQDLLDNFDAWHDQPACWQRDIISLRKMSDPLMGCRLDYKDQPAGYCILGGSDEAVALVDVGINPDAGLLMPGRLLLQAVAAQHYGSSMSIMNVPADDSLSRILAALRFLVTLRQIEMVMEL
jgi:ribosomal protein S18 acetylase RimI-like enzyme